MGIGFGLGLGVKFRDEVADVRVPGRTIVLHLAISEWFIFFRLVIVRGGIGRFELLRLRMEGLSGKLGSSLQFSYRGHGHSSRDCSVLSKQR